MTNATLMAHNRSRKPACGRALPDHRFVGCLERTAATETWESRSPDGQRWLVKVLFNVAGPGPERAEAIGRLEAIQHPNLVPTLLLSGNPGCLVIVSEFPAATLLDRLKQDHPDGEGGIARPLLLGWLRTAARTLDDVAAEHGVSHLALSPRHLILAEDTLLLAEYGLAQLLWLPTRQFSGQVQQRYTAPELTKGGQPGPACDQFSLAAIFQELLTGTPPFRARPTAAPDLSLLEEGDRAIIAQALEFDPRKRFPSCTDLIDALENVGVEKAAIPSTETVADSNEAPTAPVSAEPAASAADVPEAAPEVADATLQLTPPAASVPVVPEAAPEVADATLQLTPPAASVPVVPEAAPEVADATLQLTPPAASVPVVPEAAPEVADATLQLTPPAASAAVVPEAAPEVDDATVQTAFPEAPQAAVIEPSDRSEDDICTIPLRAFKVPILKTLDLEPELPPQIIRPAVAEEPVPAASDQAEPEPFATEEVQAEPEPFATEAVQAEPEPFATEAVQAEPEPFAMEAVQAEPEPFVTEAVQAEPEPFAAEATHIVEELEATTAEPIAAEPELFAAEATRIAAEPEPFVAEAASDVEDLEPFAAEAASDVEDLEPIVAEAASDVEDLEPFAAEAASDVEDLGSFAAEAARDVKEPEPFVAEPIAPEPEPIVAEAASDVEDLELFAAEAVQAEPEPFAAEPSNPPTSPFANSSMDDWASDESSVKLGSIPGHLDSDPSTLTDIMRLPAPSAAHVPVEADATEPTAAESDFESAPPVEPSRLLDEDQEASDDDFGGLEPGGPGHPPIFPVEDPDAFESPAPAPAVEEPDAFESLPPAPTEVFPEFASSLQNLRGTAPSGRPALPDFGLPQSKGGGLQFTPVLPQASSPSDGEPPPRSVSSSPFDPDFVPTNEGLDGPPDWPFTPTGDDAASDQEDDGGGTAPGDPYGHEPSVAVAEQEPDGRGEIVTGDVLDLPESTSPEPEPAVQSYNVPLRTAQLMPQVENDWPPIGFPAKIETPKPVFRPLRSLRRGEPDAGKGKPGASPDSAATQPGGNLKALVEAAMKAMPPNEPERWLETPEEGEVLECRFPASLPPSGPPINFERFRDKWKGQILATDEDAALFEVTPQKKFWKRLLGRATPLYVEVRWSRPRPPAVGIPGVMMRVRLANKDDKNGLASLHSMAPQLIESLRSQLQGGSERRREKRILWVQPVAATFLLSNGDSSGTVDGQSRDVSETGMGLYLPRILPGTQVALKLTDPAAEAVIVLGKFVRVQRCGDGWYEVGVRFET